MRRDITTQNKITNLIFLFYMLITSNIILAAPIIENRGYAFADNLWQKSPDGTGTTSIPVCWINPNTVPAGELDWVEDAVSDTWEAESLVRFTGWTTCPVPATDFPGVRIIIEDVEGNAVTTWGIGRGLMHIKDPNKPRDHDGGMRLNFKFINWAPGCPKARSRKKCIEMTAIHEFGHALSFAHEQNRPEGIPTDLDCEIQGDSEVITPGHWATVGLWDINSIMNYCNKVSYNNGELSAVDKYMVKAAYGNVPIYNSASQFACFPVVLSGGKKYSGCLKQVGGKWQAEDILETKEESTDAAILSGGRLSIPFAYSYDDEDVTGFYKDLTFQQGADGLFILTSPAVPL